MTENQKDILFEILFYGGFFIALVSAVIVSYLGAKHTNARHIPENEWIDVNGVEVVSGQYADCVSDTNEFIEYCIALGWKAGYYWTNEKRMFAFSFPDIDANEPHGYTEYSTEMTHDEYLNIHNVVKRALQNRKHYDE